MYRARAHTKFIELAEAATDQFGLVTIDDAHEVGYEPKTLAKLAERGQLERVSRGVYRVPFLPGGAMQAYMAAALWPPGAPGVLTHQTGLEFWDVSDVNQAKIHIAVPRWHRPQRAIPKAYVIHREDLDPADVAAIEGVPVVKLERYVSAQRRISGATCLSRQHARVAVAGCSALRSMERS